MQPSSKVASSQFDAASHNSRVPDSWCQPTTSAAQHRREEVEESDPVISHCTSFSFSSLFVEENQGLCLLLNKRAVVCELLLQSCSG